MAGIGVAVGLGLAAAGYFVLHGRGSPAPAPNPPPVDSAALAAAQDSARRAAADSSLGTIVIVADLDEDAEIYLNGRLVRGLTHRVTPGAYDLEVHVPGFQPFEETIVVAAGRTMRVEPDLVPVPGEGQTPITPLPEGRAALSVRAVPPHAQIVVESGEPVTGELSNEPIVSGRPVRIRISAPGYVTFDTLVVAAPGATLNLGLRTLTPQP